MQVEGDGGAGAEVERGAFGFGDVALRDFQESEEAT